MIAVVVCAAIIIPGLTYIDLPFPIPNSANLPITSVQCHEDMRKPLTDALNCIKIKGREAELVSFDGCYCYRNIAGTDRLSTHAKGKAIDINASTNRPGQIPTLSPTIIDCFEEAGFEWGGRWKTPDGMHMELKGDK